MPSSNDVSLPSASPIELRGWRVVRALGTSAIATTALVVPVAPNPLATPRVLRLFSTQTSDARIDAEVAVHDALGDAAPGPESSNAELEGDRERPHWARAEALVSADDDRLGLLIEAVAGPTAVSWLDEHGLLHLGHVTTLLAPIADAVRRAHDAGVMGIVPELQAIRLDSAGTPIIVRLHDGVARPPLPERFRRADAVHEYDRQALAGLVTSVSHYVESAAQSRVRLLAAVALEGPQSLWEALLHEARPEPLSNAVRRDASVQVDGDETGTRRERRATSPGHGADPTDERDARPAPPVEAAVNLSEHHSDRAHAVRARVADTMLSMGLPESLRSSVDTSVARAFSTAQRLGEALRARTRGSGLPVRPRFLVLGAAGVLAVVIAVAGVVAPDVSADAANVAFESDAAPTTAPARDAPSDVGFPVSDAAPEAVVHPEPDEWDSIVQQLLERWSACRSVRGDACAHTVAHPRSAADVVLTVDDDRHGLIDAWLLGERQLVVVEQMGSAVLVDLIDAERTTASLLLFRSEAGWRVRDVLD